MKRIALIMSAICGLIAATALMAAICGHTHQLLIAAIAGVMCVGWGKEEKSGIPE